MRWHVRLAVLLSLWVLSFGGLAAVDALTAPPAAAAPTAATVRLDRALRPGRAFVLVIDSLRYQTAVSPELMPHLYALRQRSTFARVTPTRDAVTVPCLRAAFTGRDRTRVFGFVENFLKGNAGLESLFTQLAAAGRAAAVYSDGAFDQFGDQDITRLSNGDPEAEGGESEDRRDHVDEQNATLPVALADYLAGKHDLVVLHVTYTDHVAHEVGIDAPLYAERYRAADALVAQLDRELPEDATLVVMGDHGHDAQGRHAVGLDVPTYALYRGARFAAGMDLATVSIRDHRYLLGYALGLSLPGDYGGERHPGALAAGAAGLGSYAAEAHGQRAVSPGVPAERYAAYGGGAVLLACLFALWLQLSAASASGSPGARPASEWAPRAAATGSATAAHARVFEQDPPADGGSAAASAAGARERASELNASADRGAATASAAAAHARVFEQDPPADSGAAAASAAGARERATEPNASGDRARVFEPGAPADRGAAAASAGGARARVFEPEALADGGAAAASAAGAWLHGFGVGGEGLRGICSVLAALAVFGLGFVFPRVRPFVHEPTYLTLSALWLGLWAVAGFVAWRTRRVGVSALLLVLPLFVAVPTVYRYGAPPALGPAWLGLIGCVAVVLLRQKLPRPPLMAAALLCALLLPFGLAEAVNFRFEEWVLWPPAWLPAGFFLLALVAKLVVFVVLVPEAAMSGGAEAARAAEAAEAAGPSGAAHKARLALTGVAATALVTAVELDAIAYVPQLLAALLLLLAAAILTRRGRRGLASTACVTGLLVLHHYAVRVPASAYHWQDCLLAALMLSARCVRRLPAPVRMRAHSLLLLFAFFMSGWVSFAWTLHRLEWRFLYDFWSAAFVETHVGAFLPLLMGRFALPLIAARVLLTRELCSSQPQEARHALGGAWLLAGSKVASLMFWSYGIAFVSVASDVYLEAVQETSLACVLLLGLL